MKTTPEQMAKLPKWTQDYIKTIERQRDVAIRRLDDFTNSQKESKIYFDGWDCTGEQCGPTTRRHYVQSNYVTIAAHGVELRVLIRDNHIDLSWSNASGPTADIALIPWSYNKAILKSKENMR